jgi:hypothetical protein
MRSQRPAPRRRPRRLPRGTAARRRALRNPSRGMRNVILTPHIGGSTEEAQENIARFVPDKILGYLEQGSTALSVNFPNLQLPALRRRPPGGPHPRQRARRARQHQPGHGRAADQHRGPVPEDQRAGGVRDHRRGAGLGPEMRRAPGHPRHDPGPRALVSGRPFSFAPGPPSSTPWCATSSPHGPRGVPEREPPERSGPGEVKRLDEALRALLGIPAGPPHPPGGVGHRGHGTDCLQGMGDTRSYHLVNGAFARRFHAIARNQRARGGGCRGARREGFRSRAVDDPRGGSPGHDAERDLHRGPIFRPPEVQALADRARAGGPGRGGPGHRLAHRAGGPRAHRRRVLLGAEGLRASPGAGGHRGLAGARGAGAGAASANAWRVGLLPPRGAGRRRGPPRDGGHAQYPGHPAPGPGRRGLPGRGGAVRLRARRGRLRAGGGRARCRCSRGTPAPSLRGRSRAPVPHRGRGGGGGARSPARRPSSGRAGRRGARGGRRLWPLEGEAPAGGPLPGPDPAMQARLLEALDEAVHEAGPEAGQG